MNKVVKCQEVGRSVGLSVRQVVSQSGRAQKKHAVRHFQSERTSERVTNKSPLYPQGFVRLWCTRESESKGRVGGYPVIPVGERKAVPSAQKRARRDWDQPAWNRNVGGVRFFFPSNTQWLAGCSKYRCYWVPFLFDLCYVFVKFLSVQLLVHSGTDGTPNSLLLYELCMCANTLFFCFCFFVAAYQRLVVSVFNPGSAVQISNSAEFFFSFFLFALLWLRWKEVSRVRICS